MARIERDVHRRQPVVVAARHGGGDASGVAGRFLGGVGITHARVTGIFEAEDIALEVQLEIAARGRFLHAAVVAEVLDGGAAIEIGVVGGIGDIGDQPRCGGAAGLARIAQIDDLRDVRGDREAVDRGRAGHLAENQILGAVGAAGRGIALEQLGAEVVAPPDRAGLHREAIAQIPLGAQLRGLEAVLHVGRTVADFGQLEVGRIGHVEAVVQHRRLHVRIVVAEAVGGLVVIGDRGFDRDIRVRLRHAAQEGEAEAVRNVLIPGRADLVEFGFRLAQVAFGADVGVVERGADHVAVVVVDRIHHVETALVGAGQHFQPLFGALFLERGIEPVDRDLGAVGRFELDRAGQAKALAVMLDHAVARDARVERKRGFIAGCRGTIAAAGTDRAATGRADVRVEARVAVHRVEIGLRPAHRIVPGFQRIGVRIGARQRDAERARVVLPCQQAGDARADVLRQVVVRTLHVEHGGNAGLARKRIAGVEIDHRAQRAFVEAGFGGLVDHKAAEQFGGENVEIERAVAVGAGAVGAGGDGFQAVHAHAGELGAKTAHGDRAAFAAVTLDRDAGDALERFGKVLVGELGHVLSHDGVDRRNRIALHAERGFQRLAIAGDDDGFGWRVFGADGSGGRRVGILREHRLRHGQRGAGSPQCQGNLEQRNPRNMRLHGHSPSRPSWPVYDTGVIGRCGQAAHPFIRHSAPCASQRTLMHRSVHFGEPGLVLATISDTRPVLSCRSW